MATNSRRLKTRKLDMRLTEQQEQVIRRAAELKNKTLTSFVVETAYEAAEQVLLDQRRFVLSEEQWLAFNAVLDAPPKVLPGLKRLMSKPDTWDDDQDETPNPA